MQGMIFCIPLHMKKKRIGFVGVSVMSKTAVVLASEKKRQMLCEMHLY